MVAGDPLWAYAYVAGYAARCREEAAAWQEESAARVFVAGQFWDRPTAAERKTEREAIMREAHTAGLHDHRPIMCPWCQRKGDS